MSAKRFGFNMILAVVATLFFLGCKSPEERERARKYTKLWLHLDSLPGTPDTNSFMTVTIAGVDIAVQKLPFLTEAFLSGATLVETPDGGYSIRAEYDYHGKLVLDTTTSEYKRRRIVVYTEWGQKRKEEEAQTRYLGAPLITHRLSEGVFTFTPSATRDEAAEIVVGLKNVAAENMKPYVF